MKSFIKGLVFTVGQFALVTLVAFSLSDCGKHDGGNGNGGGGGGGEVVKAAPAGGDAPAGDAPAGDAPAGDAPAPAATAGPATATIKGVCKFVGTPPKRLPIPMGQADPLCVQVNEGQQVLTENVIVGDDGSLENVFISVENPPSKGEPPSEPAVIDQNGCMYRPHVFGMMAGQELEIRNSDKSNHNINVLAKVNRGFNVNQGPGQEPMRRKDFRRPEGPIEVKCNVHPWMNARIFVLDHPFFVVAREGGTFELPQKLPAGTYTVKAWHEQLGEQTQEVTVADGETKEITFEFKK